MAALTTAIACGGGDEDVQSDDEIVIGTVLPFTGEDATIGENLEQAMLLAVEDVNRAGGVAGKKLRLVARDSNSGSGRGLDSLLDLLYVEKVRYLIGPEENELADEVVPDIKGLDIFNVLPGYASPPVERVGGTGRWLRLPPSALAFGCGLSELARITGVETTNALVAQDDFNQSVASEFVTEFVDAGGRSFPSTTVRAGEQSYLPKLNSALSLGTDRTLLFVNPTTAATLLTEWEIGSKKGSWLFGPTLHTPGLLPNVPFPSLDGTLALSPTLSLTTECEAREEDYRGVVNCTHSNAEAFSDYFAERWHGNRPFPPAHFYYDAVILLAMGLEYADAAGNSKPSAAELHGAILELHEEEIPRSNWRDLDEVMKRLGKSDPVGLVGAATKYDFDRFGAARHLIFDAWRIQRQRFVRESTFQARCLRQPK